MCSLHFTTDCIFLLDDRKCLRGDAVPTVFVDAIPTVFIECFVQSSEFVDLSSPLTSTCDTDTAASSLSTALQWQSDAVNTSIVKDVASSSTQHCRTAQIASVDDVTLVGDEDGDKGSRKQSSMQNKDHTYYRRSVRVTKKKTVNNNDHNYFSLVPSC